jgi:hypothetical protein
MNLNDVKRRQGRSNIVLRDSDSVEVVNDRNIEHKLLSLGLPAASVPDKEIRKTRQADPSRDDAEIKARMYKVATFSSLFFCVNVSATIIHFHLFFPTLIRLWLTRTL